MAQMFLYEYDVKYLPSSLIDRIEECLPDETGYVTQTFVCPHCGSMCISHYDTNDFGDFFYRCFDCESVLSEEELELV